MKYIIYISTASIYFDTSSLEKMLLQYRKNNEATQVTGMMLFSEGIFLQVLEGKQEDVDKLIKKILKDKRHHSIIQLGSALIEERIFKTWSMGFQQISKEEFKQATKFINLDVPETISAPTQDNRHPAVAILQDFAKNMKMN
ncbi:MAG: BLUF domain-containing protein [Janthinobacterium lividum]